MKTAGMLGDQHRLLMSMSMDISTQAGQTINQIYTALHEAYGPQGWWPGESPTEIAIGAVLVQNTNWLNVEKAIARLRAAGMVDWTALYRLPIADLAELIRPAGYYRVKARRLKNLVAWLCERHEGRLEKPPGRAHDATA